MQSRGNAGIPLTTNTPFGYKKDPEDKNRWIVDKPAAEIVQRIFQMCVSGLGPAQIAKRLKADGVLTPSEYQRSIGVNCPTKLPEYPHKWRSHTVAEILDRLEYVGDTVNFRTYRQSFKQKKQLDRPQEDWKVFPNTHPAIIAWETFHFIREKVIEGLVLEGLQRLLWYIQVYEMRFAQEQMERFGLQEKKELTAKRRELDKASSGWQRLANSSRKAMRT